MKNILTEEIVIPDGHNTLQAAITPIDNPKSWVIFAHGSGSSHCSPRNRLVANYFHTQGISTLLFDLLNKEEDIYYRNRFHIPLMANRMLAVTRWLMDSSYYKQSGNLEIGYFGGSTGAGVILEAAAKAEEDDTIPLNMIVSRGGRPDLVDEEVLATIQIPVLFIVGEQDPQVLKLNEVAANIITDSKIEIIPAATHLFTEPGALENVAKVAANAFMGSKANILVSPNQRQEIFVE